MTLSVFDAATAGYLAVDPDIRSMDVLPAVIQRFAGLGTEVRAAVQVLGRRRYTVTIHATKAETLLVDAFWRLRNYQIESVLFLDPRLSTRTGVSLGTSVTSQVVFNLPASGENSRDYPKAGKSTVVLYDDGAPITVSTLSTDSRTITASAAPANGSVMTADYSFYRRVRLVEPYEWTGLAPDFFVTTIGLLEVPA